MVSIRSYAGEPLFLRLTVLDEDGAPIDVSGASIQMAIGPVGSTDALATFAAHAQVVDGPSGRVDIVVPAAEADAGIPTDRSLALAVWVDGYVHLAGLLTRQSIPVPE
ncbi:hypothetical protein [Oceanicella actignis]|uniref:hypothetical protein n=1 Tax=Oceanicella actignis TaxID=1189325 RepID=UPI0011E85D26|nr:hypothetical protein [Oceanicella actignis]TYO91419.1 hypothetical protein LY05_00272 [Oceanicella actignis]